jgi:hypothetical protein
VATQLPVLNLGASRSDPAGAFVSVQFTATGGRGPYTWASNNIPDGLSLNPATGVVSGTPTTVRGYSLQVTATDQFGRTGHAPLGWSITPAQATVPSLEGRTRANAISVLAAVGLVIGHTSQSHLCEGRIGTIVRQNPAPGTRVTVGSAVSVTVEGGPPPGLECP